MPAREDLKWATGPPFAPGCLRRVSRAAAAAAAWKNAVGGAAARCATSTPAIPTRRTTSPTIRTTIGFISRPICDRTCPTCRRTSSTGGRPLPGNTARVHHARHPHKAPTPQQGVQGARSVPGCLGEDRESILSVVMGLASTALPFSLQVLI